jgi:hypothetical protein
MSDSDRPPGSGQSPADRTLLGVAPPKLESSPELGSRSPVFVRSGTSVAPEAEQPPPLPRMALPSRPALTSPDGKPLSELPPPLSSAVSVATGQGPRSGSIWARVRDAARLHPALWMVGAPVVAALVVVLIVAATAPAKAPRASAAVVEKAAAPGPVEVAPPVAKEPHGNAAVSAKASGADAQSSTSGELLESADRSAVSRQERADALAAKLASSPELAQDLAVQTDLLALAADPLTARRALAAMTKLNGPLGPDLLYEVWTGTPARNDTTELARSLVYSKDVSTKASPALAVALQLRSAETCEEQAAILPKASASADRRSVHLLSKLLAKRGCGPKKTEDCFACLRAQQPQLTAAIDAAKSRRAPTF